MKTSLRRLILALVAATALAAPTSAPAAENPPPGEKPLPGESAIDQYVEDLPAGGGRTAVGRGGGKRKALPQRTRERIRDEIDRLARGTSPGARARLREEVSVLEQVATSAAYGAPQVTLAEPTGRARSGQPRRMRVFDREDVTRKDVPTEKVLSTAVHAAADVSEARVAGLFGALTLISGSALGAASYRRRKPRR